MLGFPYGTSYSRQLALFFGKRFGTGQDLVRVAREDHVETYVVNLGRQPRDPPRRRRDVRRLQQLGSLGLRKQRPKQNDAGSQNKQITNVHHEDGVTYNDHYKEPIAGGNAMVEVSK